MKLCPRFRAPALVLSLLLTLASTSGCSLHRVAADQTAEIAEAGATGFNAFWDYEIFGQAVPSAILQAEALIRVSPDNEKLLTGLARTYAVYAFGWMTNDWEVADERGEFERADELERRIMRIYERASKLGLRVMRRHDDEGKLDQVLATRKVDALRDYLARAFKDQDDVPGLYWAGLTWGAMMANSGGDLAVLADAPLARALLERSVALNPSYNDGGGLGALGSVEASFPELFGGDLEKARGYYERALAISKRKNHLIQVSYAKTYAVAKQDRALFVQLLQEVLSAPDQGDDLRMSNKVAHHRAKRYLGHVDDWFPPQLPDEPTAATP